MAILVAAGPWWAFVLRGALAILFGVATFLWPGMALLSLVLLFGVYAVCEGLFNIAGAVQSETPRRERRWVLLVAGFVSVLAGVIAFVAPGLTALSLLLLIAAWAIVRGVLEITAALAVRKEIEGEWLFLLGGLLSVVFGVAVMVFPGAGALAVVLWIGAYAIVFGALLVGFGLRLRKRTHTGPPGGGFREFAPNIGH